MCVCFVVVTTCNITHSTTSFELFWNQIRVHCSGDKTITESDQKFFHNVHQARELREWICVWLLYVVFEHVWLTKHTEKSCFLQPFFFMSNSEIMSCKQHNSWPITTFTPHNISNFSNQLWPSHTFHTIPINRNPSKSHWHERTARPASSQQIGQELCALML